ncbi:MAG: hypothetical protein ABI579_01555, partial [Candidatus Sumerlaeota bacterium]
MAEQAAAVQPRGKKKPTRLRRILRGLALCVAAIVLLLVLAPTLITWLPVERIVESKANAILRGNLELSGLKVGWVSPLRVQKIALRESKDANAPVVFYLEDFSVEKGLIGNIFSDDRLGEVRLRVLGVDATHRPDGTINIVDALPESKKEEKPKEPFELSIQKYLPTMKLPVVSIDAAIDAIHITYRDEAITTAPMTIKYDGKAVALWRGGATPLNASAQGTVAVDGRSAPLLVLAEVKNWTDGKTLDLSKSTMSARAFPAINDKDPALLESSIEINGDKAAAEFTFRAERLPPVMALLPPELRLPA